MTSLRKCVQALALSSLLVALAGCGIESKTSGAAPVATPAFQPVLRGSVHGGQQPVAGATIQLYALGYLVDGTPGTPLLTQPVITDAAGGFNLTGLFSCTDYGKVVYLTATGGNPGLAPGTYNKGIAAMAMLDVCGILTPNTFININEVTTAATVVAYGQFFSQYPNIGTAFSNSAPAYNQVLYYDMIASTASGTSPGTTFPAGQQFPFDVLYSTANIISACINSAGGVAGDGSACGNLYKLTTPPGGTAPTNTVDALVNMQRYPTQNVSQIFALSTPSAPFQPAAKSAPANWYMRLTTGAPTTPRYNLCTTWGDSLTLGSEDNSGITVADTLPMLSSCYWGNNQGVGGNDSTQIGIREGGLASTATITGGTIPASGPVNISFPDYSAPVTNNGPGQTTTVISGVPGNISFDYNQYTTVFTRTTPGTPVASPANTAYQAVLTNENSGFVVLWAGRNDADSQQTLILNNLAAMVAALPSPKHFVILSIPNTNEEGEYAGTTGYNQIIATNQAIANTYPNNYIDERALVIANYNPNSPEDVLDHNHDTTPTSMRAIDGYGDLAAPMDASTCNLTLENGGISIFYTLNIEQEKIRILGTTDNQHVTSCIRGYAGTTAVAHSAKTTFTGTDSVHLNHLADVLIANAIDKYIQAH